MLVLRKMGSFVLALLLAVALLPLGVAGSSAEKAHAAQTGWETRIPELLAAGEYVPGEVLVAVSTQVAAPRARSVDVLAGAQDLMGVSASAYETTTGTALDDAQGGARSASATSAASLDEPVSIKLVSGAASTEELLYELAQDPRVLFAEPNYRGQLSDEALDEAPLKEATERVAETQEGKSEKEPLDKAAADAGLPSPQEAGALPEGSPEVEARETATAATEPVAAAASSVPFTPKSDAVDVTASAADFTGYQWGNHNAANSPVAAGPSRKAGFDIKSPDWKAQDASKPNAAGVVAIVDTGIDYNHPDLQGVMADMSAYADEGFGKYGINVSRRGDAKDPMDTHMHGTHCAGIVASAWNGKGTSGVANGAKLVGVKVSEGAGISFSDIVVGYEALSRAVDKGLNLVAINNSFGGSGGSMMFSMMIAKLGEKGAVSLVASGNESLNSDVTGGTSASLVTNPYAVVVNASAITGVRPSFSNYGVATTDVFAPGSSILSTVPLKQGRYYPSSAPNAVAYDSFDKPGTSSVTAHRDAGSTVSDSNKIGTVDAASNFHFDTAGSLKLEGKDLYKENPDQYTDYSVLLKIPFEAAKAANIRNIGLTASASGATFAMGAGIQTADGSFVSDPNNRIGLIYGWDMLTINLPELLKGKQAVYQVDENGKAFMVVKLMFKSHPQPGTSDNFTLYLDMVGMGNETAGYHFASGTSMATPMAVGVTAVHMQRIAQANAGLSPAERARLGAATVRGSVETVADFEGLCTSGGQVSLDPGVVMTPVINSAKLAGSAKDATITIEGYFFGDAKNTVTIAGKTASVVSWSDRSIVVQCPEGVTEGAREIMVNNTAGKTGRKTLNLPIPANPGDGSLPLFEETIALPDNMFGKESLSNKLIGLGGKVYTLICNPDKMYGDLWSYDPATKQWQQHPSMPSNLDCVSTTLYDGKILVLGRCGDNQDEKKMFSFDPSTNTWAQIDGIDRVPLGAALVNAAGTLLLVGGEKGSATTGATKAAPALLETDNIAVFDFATGSVTPVGTLKESRMTWQFANEGQDVAIVAHGSDVYVAGGMKYEAGSSDPVRLSPTSMERLTKTENGYVSQMIGSSLPPLAQAAGYPVDYGLTAIKAGPVVSGLKAATDAGGKKLAEPDTYVLDVTHPEAGFANLGKRAAYGPLFYPQTTAYEGVLYTMGIDSFEETQMVLRGTAVETLPQAGDIVSPVKPEPQEPNAPQEPKAPKAPGSLVATGDTTGTLMAFAGLLAAVGAAVMVVCVIRARLQRKW